MYENIGYQLEKIAVEAKGPAYKRNNNDPSPKSRGDNSQRDANRERIRGAFTSQGYEKDSSMSHASHVIGNITGLGGAANRQREYLKAVRDDPRLDGQSAENRREARRGLAIQNAKRAGTFGVGAALVGGGAYAAKKIRDKKKKMKKAALEEAVAYVLEKTASMYEDAE